MPYIVQGSSSVDDMTIEIKDHYDYDYPEGLDLRPNSDLHKKLRTRILSRAQTSRTEIQKRFDSWNEIDRTLTVYMDVNDYEKKLKGEEPDKPTHIVFPYTYSMLESLLTYFSLAFFQDPIFQYEGVEDDDTVGAILMEMVVRLHCIKNKVALNIHTALRDSLAYGVGIVVPGWKQLYGKRMVKTMEQTESVLGVSETPTMQMQTQLLFEGNTLENIDPYMWLPDPSVASSNIQGGEFIGWISKDNLMSLLREEVEGKTGKFNIKYLKGNNKRSCLALDQSDRQAKHGGSTEVHTSISGTTNIVDIIKMYIDLIPKDWGLSDNENPEKWYFELAADDVIIACEKADHNHGLYPMAVASPEFDGYSITPIGRLEVLYGLQHTLDFLFNSHVENVRKAINDMLIVDPYLVNIEDLKDPRPGKLIRLRRPAWGRGVDKVVQQLQVNDITQANISDSAYITQWMDRISGADQSMQGALRQGGPERLTSAEFQGTRSSAVSRLQRIAMIISMQLLQDVGSMFAVHTQQYMQQDTYVKVVGRYADVLKGIYPNPKVQVTPYDLAVNYDLVVRDGSIPGGNFSGAWIELFKIIGTQPELMQVFDVSRIFSYIATELGAKNIDDFKRNVNQISTQTMPDAQVTQQAQAGNLVPVGGM